MNPLTELREHQWDTDVGIDSDVHDQFDGTDKVRVQLSLEEIALKAPTDEPNDQLLRECEIGKKGGSRAEEDRHEERLWSRRQSSIAEVDESWHCLQLRRATQKRHHGTHALG
jgi:hypothetical protein